MENSKFTRRQFVGRAVFFGASVVLSPYGILNFSETANASDLLASITAGTFFTEAQRALLATFSESIFPGAVELGAVAYIETLMTAFDSNPPKIYAAGPYSGRNPYSKNGQVTTVFPNNSFQTFMPLTRYQEAAWRYKLYGSKGLPGGGPNDAITGKQKGLRDILTQGLDQAAASQSGFASMSKEFRESLTELVLEGCFAAPEYGGNKGLAGWRLVQFEGDSQPLGYSMYDPNSKVYNERPESPLSTANPVPDDANHRLSPRVKLLLFAITEARKLNL